MPRLRSLAAVVLFGTMTFACNRVRVDEVRGPDGDAWMKISCRRMDQRCYKTALAMCPNGYYFTRVGSGAVLPAPKNVDDAGDDDDDAPVAVPQRGRNVTKLPPQSQWDRSMYSAHRGAILVRCAGATASAD